MLAAMSPELGVNPVSALVTVVSLIGGIGLLRQHRWGYVVSDRLGDDLSRLCAGDVCEAGDDLLHGCGAGNPQA
jgi:hypothetical protein